MEFITKVLRTIQSFHLLEKKDRILLACSGGADSICLLHVLHSLQEEWEWNLQIAHFNHQLRPESGEDELFVRKWASDLNLPYFTRSQDVAASARENKSNLEETGRDLRYAFLVETAHASGANKIATAHTMDDQAETFLMRMMRGTGPTGLSGIPMFRGDRFIRPLLQVTRSEVERYLKSLSLDFQKDLSNWDRRYLRNRIRLDLLPYIQKSFDPHIVPHLGRMTEVLQEEEAWMEALVREAAAVAIFPEGETWTLDKNILRRFPKALQRRLVRLFLVRLRGNLRGISYEDIETILTLKEGRKFTLEKDLWLHRCQDKVKVLQPEASASPVSFSYTWYQGEGEELFISELEMRLSQDVSPRSDSLDLKQDDQSAVVLDFDKLSFPLTVRSREPGDRYRILGAPGRTKLKEILRAHGISPAERDRYPVIVSGTAIVWVLGLPVAEDYKVTHATQQVFRIRVIKS